LKQNNLSECLQEWIWMRPKPILDKLKDTSWFEPF
jgi:hypothetical protein